MYIRLAENLISGKLKFAAKFDDSTPFASFGYEIYISDYSDCSNPMYIGRVAVTPGYREYDSLPVDEFTGIKYVCAKEYPVGSMQNIGYVRWTPAATSKLYCRNGTGVQWWVIDGRLYVESHEIGEVYIPVQNFDTVGEVWCRDGRVYIVEHRGGQTREYGPFETPVVFEFDVKTNRILDAASAKYLQSLLNGVYSGVSWSAVVNGDVITVRVVKSGPGVVYMAVAVIAAVAFLLFSVGVLIQSITQLRIIQAKEYVINKIEEVKQRYLDEVSKCTDAACVETTRKVYEPLLTSYTNALGALSIKEEKWWEREVLGIPLFLWVIMAFLLLFVLTMR